jgi:hypothetical protein
MTRESKNKVDSSAKAVSGNSTFSQDTVLV